MNGRKTAIVMLIALGLLAGCSGDGALTAELITSGERLAAPQMLSVEAKVTSGVPEGIFVTWTRVDSPRAQGYYLYRYTDSNRPPEPGPDDNPPFPIELRTNDGSMIPQPADGETVTFNDIFELVIGTIYYYRVTVVDDDVPPQESYPSAEESWMAHGHNVAALTPTEAYWGDDVTITGDTFGTYDEGTDSVRFLGVDASQLAGAIVSWTETEIVATVPEDVVTGRVAVVIGGTIAYTDDDLAILNPIITDLAPSVGFVEQDLTVSGLKFGAVQGDSTVQIGMIDVTPAVHSWADEQVVLTVPALISRGSVRLTVGGHPSNRLLFTARPEILELSTTSAQIDELVTLSGRHYMLPAGTVELNGQELAVEAWTQESITVTISGEPGEHLMTVVSSEAHRSNDVAFEIVEPLTVALSGLDPEAVYRPTDMPPVGITTAADAERVELLIDDLVVGEPSTTPPFDDLVLPVAALTNGYHLVKLRAYRRAIVADSEELLVTIYSLIGDVNGDGVVNDDDRLALITHLWLTAADPGYRPWYDTNDDGLVNEADLSAVGYHWDEAVQQ